MVLGGRHGQQGVLAALLVVDELVVDELVDAAGGDGFADPLAEADAPGGHLVVGQAPGGGVRVVHHVAGAEDQHTRLAQRA
ncbi:hypothetical protein QFZ63_005972 [Streptomyces sp. B3I7]|nr:hypothetical protein [Streptomyces sp. B3I7]MDQ0814258.1 hypothetical protein [Streptomyces sp. B3I7]